ncbi:hypothetical protein TNCT_21661 [Trichonephila clavata]|uniref:Uncharacterized protein n=1 Tax=Trichonephila clavata TaxID=2740835 RepID=A0A8X6M2N0_TRICU|nr:hypothetical protein TNCT_21661 [Trichonephila clavata]
MIFNCSANPCIICQTICRPEFAFSFVIGIHQADVRADQSDRIRILEPFLRCYVTSGRFDEFHNCSLYSLLKLKVFCSWRVNVVVDLVEESDRIPQVAAVDSWVAVDSNLIKKM